MNRLVLAIVATAAIAYPACAQQQGQRQPAANQPARSQNTHQQISGDDLSPQQIRDIQNALKQKGFASGRVDGLWGPHTETALRDFQKGHAMQASGQVDQQSLSALGLDTSKFATSEGAGTVGAGNRRGDSNNINIAAFHDAKMGVLDAISAVTENGSMALDVRFDLRDSKPVYYVRTYTPDQKTFWEGMVDANTGKVMGQGTTTPQSQLSQTEKDQLDALKNAKWSLEDAVNAAEEHRQADAINAWVVGKNYEIMVDKNGSPQKLTVDPMSQKVTTG